MGNWNINIQGIGSHHTGNSAVDADAAAIELVATLRERGHQIESASFTHGGKMDLIEASKPLGRMVRAILNGQERELPDVMDYRMVLIQAMGDKFREDAILTVVYEKARFGKQGSLTRGQSIELVDGTRISAYDTSNA